MNSQRVSDTRALSGDDAKALWELRLEALEREPRAFGSSPEEHRQTSSDHLAKRLRSGGDDNFVIGAYSGSVLVGMAGFAREPRLKRRHIGGIWGVFVKPEYRGQGIARWLLSNLIDKARGLDGLRVILLSVATTQEPARRLYESVGFRPFGHEPLALLVDGEYVSEEHLWLDLTQRA